MSWYRGRGREGSKMCGRMRGGGGRMGSLELHKRLHKIGDWTGPGLK